jgi:tetratricopeptide (TPR) repeat protein
MRASVRLLFLCLILPSTVWAQTGPTPNSLAPNDLSRLPRVSQTVSMRDLLIPPKAVKELRRSQNALRSGDTRASARHLERALRIYPNYLEGHNSLGARYLELHEYEKAAAEFQKAIDIDPRVRQPVNNLSVALFLEQRYVDAEAAARRARDLDPQDATPRYMLGAILATENRNPVEAMEMLRQTKNEFPDARLLLAKVLERRGDVKGAETELQDYLALPDAGKRQNVERWLLRLSQNSTANSSTEPGTP